MRFTSEEAFEDETITMNLGAVKKTLRQHDANYAEFITECGDREEYPAHVVLAWLGY